MRLQCNSKVRYLIGNEKRALHVLTVQYINDMELSSLSTLND